MSLGSVALIGNCRIVQLHIVLYISRLVLRAVLMSLFTIQFLKYVSSSAVKDLTFWVCQGKECFAVAYVKKINKNK